MYQLPSKNSPEPYNPTLEPIDERLCQLLAERNKKAGANTGIPDATLLKKWARQFDLPGEWLLLFFSRLEYRQPPVPFVMPVNLRSVVPLMKHTEQGDFIYTLTHMMQYENASVVNLQIGPKQPDPYHTNINPQLNLSVVGKVYYQVQVQRSGSYSGMAGMKFTVTPPLPDDLHGIEFSLVPFKRENPPIREVVLDNPVDFD